MTYNESMGWNYSEAELPVDLRQTDTLFGVKAVRV